MGGMLQIEEVTNVDQAPQISALAAKTFPLACPPYVSVEDIAQFIANELSPANFETFIGDPQEIILRAFDDERVLGYSRTILGSAPLGENLEPLPEPFSLLSKFYVDPDSHGQGIAPQLMQATLEAVKQRGAASMWLGVNAENQRAIGFYTKSGFRQIGTRSFYVGDTLNDDLVLGREIY